MSTIPIDVQRRFEQGWARRFNRSPAPKSAGQPVVQLGYSGDGSACQHEIYSPDHCGLPVRTKRVPVSERAAGVGD
jgi:hypothetical protein